ncbi:MAG: hypothetical protein ACRECD_15040 [Burkholderiaceae bacterium]
MATKAARAIIQYRVHSRKRNPIKGTGSLVISQTARNHGNQRQPRDGSAHKPNNKRPNRID